MNATFSASTPVVLEDCATLMLMVLYGIAYRKEKKKRKIGSKLIFEAPTRSFGFHRYRYIDRTKDTFYLSFDAENKGLSSIDLIMYIVD